MKRIEQNNAMAVKLGIKGLKSSLNAMQCKCPPRIDSCSEYDPNNDSELEGDLSQCSSLVEESEEDALYYSPIKVLALTSKVTLLAHILQLMLCIASTLLNCH